MRRMTLLLLLAVAPIFAVSPYVGDHEREIKALSPERIADLAAGRGMGLALAAELNGYPGPMHVLELADELEVSDEQRVRTEALFQRMRDSAMAVGERLIQAERALDQAFATRAISSESLPELLRTIATLEAELRGVHLDAHIEQTALLTERQVAEYVRLRGYGDHGEGHDHRHGHHGHRH